MCAAVSKAEAGPAIPLRKVLLAAALTGLALLLCAVAPVSSGHTVSGVELNLPYRVNDWWGIDQEITLAEKTILPADTEFARKSYESGAGDSILCSIVLSGAEKRSIHRPEDCLPSQGWRVRSSPVVSVTLHSGRVLKATCLNLVRPVTLPDGKHSEARACYLYWFVGDGVTTYSHWKRIWLTSWDRIVHHTNHRWAYIIAYSMVTDSLRPGGKDEGQTVEMLKAFIADVVPSFEKDEMAASEPRP